MYNKTQLLIITVLPGVSYYALLDSTVICLTLHGNHIWIF